MWLKDCDLFKIMQINKTLHFIDWGKMYRLMHVVHENNLVHTKPLLHFMFVRSYWNIGRRKYVVLTYILYMNDHELSFIWLQVAMKSLFAR